MNPNILSPKKAVNSCFEKPNWAIALSLVFVSFLFWAGQAFVISGSLEMDSALFGLATSYIGFFALGIIILVIGFVFNRQAIKGKFSGLFSALSLLQIIFILVYILSIIAFYLVIPSGVAAELRAVDGTILESSARFNEVLLANAASINFMLLYGFLVLAAIVGLYGFCILVLAVKKFTDSGTIGALLISLVSAILLGFLGL
ncbi:MAG: hypothetical protein JW744_05115 [Candidatus Diapherotrites archaeon]|uniref:Yip1 domain-containing protein n=1 Tax=Candidatus Iainarchaeum sp. TaxID=3101447 RepID=A0A938YUL5_9ARCH|nr:hypothetical protein [Candidatus Diapherotrites archaeon]